MSDMKGQQAQIQAATNVLRSGKVIAYPTESCFGLGCDPMNVEAINAIIQLKSRSANKGLILIAASIEQANHYVDIGASPLSEDIHRSWPGPNTWLLPPNPEVVELLRGEFPLLAIRVTAHPVAKAICECFGGAIVSTSANLAGQPALLTVETVRETFDKNIHIVDGVIGNDAKPSTIRDGLTGKTLRQ